MKKNFKAGMWTALFAGIGFVVALLVIKWGDENDVPLLTDAYSVL